MGLTDYAGMLLRRWRLVLTGIVLGGVVGAALGLTGTAVYTSDTQLFVSSGSEATDLTTAVEASTFSEARVASYAQLLVSRELAARVVEDLGLGQTPEELIGQISASVVTGTVILDVTVTDPSPEQAQAIAASVADQFADLVDELESGRGAGVDVTVATIASADLPAAPSSLEPAALVTAGLLGGVLLGAAAAVVRDRSDTSVRTEDDAAAAGAPVLVGVPEDSTAAGGQPSPGSPFAESLGVLQTNLRFVSVDAHPRVLMVTSADQSEGKTTTAVHLAQELARAGNRVLLVDADLRRPRVADALGLVNGAGLTSVLTGQVDLEDVTQPVGDGRLTVLAAGQTPPNPAQLIGSTAMDDLLTAASSSYDLVVVDAPPLLPVADASGLAPLVDGVLLVARYAGTRRDRLERARAQLDRVGATTLGVVLSRVPQRSRSGYG
ncbi:MAG: Capsular exopolysaccharide family, partial [Klenkia sp.]|nr:Capsular exopolysaccharide family [Klenkia sp.]